ncbi:MAG: peptide chain release factor N(5)-glutamine methyltransferase, partial [Lepagella sp.]
AQKYPPLRPKKFKERALIFILYPSMTILDRSKCGTIDALRRRIEAYLTPIYGEWEARSMTRLAFHSIKGWDTTTIVINGDYPASDYLVEKMDEVLRRLAEHQPIQYILGEARFYGMDLEVTPSVLIPRPETAELVDLVVKQNTESDLRVLDVGTGSGAIAIALKRNLRFPIVEALDISADALEVARSNARRYGAEIDFRQEDIFTCDLPENYYDIIVSNPPYIPTSEQKEMERNVLDYEPHIALFVPDDNPLIYYSRIIQLAISSLKMGGKLYFEINPRFADDLKRMLECGGFVDVSISIDSLKRRRFILAEKPIAD